jgi:UMF1 family MFS transporter
MVAAIPTFLFLKEHGTAQVLPPGESLVSIGFKRLMATTRALRRFRDLMLFFVAFFFAMAGLSIVISFAFIYGDQTIRWSPSSQMAMFVITNLTATAGAVGFGFLQERWGNLRTFKLTLCIWVVAIAGIYLTPQITVWLNASLGTDWLAERVFLGMGALAGICLGATQSASRTIVALFSPESKAAEFFGFWGLFGKLAAIFGLLSLGMLQAKLGLKPSILVCGVFFIVALAISVLVSEQRGRQVAVAYAGDELPSSQA